MSLCSSIPLLTFPICSCVLLAFYFWGLNMSIVVILNVLYYSSYSFAISVSFWYLLCFFWLLFFLHFNTSYDFLQKPDGMYRNWIKEAFGTRFYFNLPRSLAVFNVCWLSQVAQMLKNPLAMQETWVQSPGQEDPLEKGMVTHSNILTWRIPWTKEPGGL